MRIFAFMAVTLLSAILPITASCESGSRTIQGVTIRDAYDDPSLSSIKMAEDAGLRFAIALVNADKAASLRDHSPSPNLNQRNLFPIVKQLYKHKPVKHIIVISWLPHSRDGKNWRMDGEMDFADGLKVLFDEELLLLNGKWGAGKFAFDSAFKYKVTRD